MNAISRTIYAFGNPLERCYGQLCLQPGGSVVGYRHPNEEGWSLKGGLLRLHNAAGSFTSEFKQGCAGTGWLGYAVGPKTPLYLIPVLSLGEIRTEANLPKLLINSLPKSGTYLLEAALTEMGYHATRLQVVNGETVDDYRGMDDAQIHIDPRLVRQPIDFEALGAALVSGEILVGHIISREEIARLCRGGALEITLVRNLRDAVTSLFRFKKAKIRPLDFQDEYWRDLSRERQFVSFLQYNYDRDIELMKNFVTSIFDRPRQRVIRFEDLFEDSETNPIWSSLGNGVIDSPEKFRAAIRKRLNTPTPTYSGGRSVWQSVWDADAEHFFDKSGLKDLNARLGYEV